MISKVNFLQMCRFQVSKHHVQLNSKYSTRFYKTKNTQQLKYHLNNYKIQTACSYLCFLSSYYSKFNMPASFTVATLTMATESIKKTWQHCYTGILEIIYLCISEFFSSTQNPHSEWVSFGVGLLVITSHYSTMVPCKMCGLCCQNFL